MSAVVEALPKTPAPAKREVKPIPARCLQLFEYRNAKWRLNVTGYPPEDYERPEFYVALSDKLRELDTLELIDTARRTWTEALVCDSQPGHAVIVKVLRQVQLPDRPTHSYGEIPDGYEVRYDAAEGTYQAFRLKDGQKMGAALRDRRQVVIDLNNHSVVRGSDRATR